MTINNYEKNIINLLEKYPEGIEYVKFYNSYEKMYGTKLKINNAKKNMEKIAIVEEIDDNKWKIKPKNNNNYELFDQSKNDNTFILGQNSNKYQCLNIYEPFSCIITGVQGSGKSYTTNKIIEGCMLETVNKCTTLICYFDSNPDVICESIGLGIGNNKVNKIIILTSPSNYFNRKKFYEKKINLDKNNLDILPLLFNFNMLTTRMIKILMNIKTGDNQLYMQAIINILRKKAKNEGNLKINDLAEFENEIKKELKLDTQQQIPLLQRLELLKSFLVDSIENEQILKYEKNYNFEELFVEGNLIIIDLTDTLIEPNDANNIFRVLIDIFRSNNLSTSKLLILDEAHKYLSIKEDGLSVDIVDIVRMQRHYGIRTIISTQNPCILNQEIIELSNFMLLHRFSSPRWFEYLCKLYNIEKEILINNLKKNTYKTLINLNTGYCILVYPKNNLLIDIKIQNRITHDFGNSITFRS